MRTRWIALVVLGMGFAAGCKTGTEPGSLPYFPLAAGNTWTYAPDNAMYGQPFQWRVTARHGDTVSLARPAGLSHPGPVTLLDGTGAIDVLLNGEGFVSFYRFAVDATWVHRDPWECDDGATLTVFEEPDPIVTPAGTFNDCIRIERRTTASCTDAGTTMEWWAPGVGLVRWDELNFYAGVPVSYRLISYDLQNR